MVSDSIYLMILITLFALSSTPNKYTEYEYDSISKSFLVIRCEDGKNSCNRSLQFVSRAQFWRAVIAINHLENNMYIAAFQATVQFEVLYTLPDESTASFTGSNAYDMLDDEQQMLIDIEQNIANIERNLSSIPESSWHEKTSRLKHAISLATPEKSPLPSDRKRSSTLKSVKSLIRFGKQRPPKDSDNEEETVSLIHATESCRTSRHASESESAPISRTGSQSSISSNPECQVDASLMERNRKTTKYVNAV
jgi:hypothetical protein